MRIYRVIWKEKFVDKMEEKHQVSTDEVEQVLFGKPHVRREKRGKVKGEDLYTAYGTTDAGRYFSFINHLIVHCQFLHAT